MKMLKIIIIVSVACLALIISTIAFFIFYQNAILNEKDFPLNVDLNRMVFNVGEKISFTAIITNNAGKDVNMSSNGEMPCVFLHNVNDTTTHLESTERVDQIFKANDKISRVFEFEASETGIYILDAHYRIVVDNIAIQNKIDAIIIEVT
ncbi:MAG: hypothetical protein QM398_10790 [Thermoproteota archaeon]|nr:hypothetical protein [Thermoproteota archaeon]NLD64985.1 hypothetical protein [Thermoproteota archaeon]